MDKQEHQTPQPPVDAIRRRLTQGALAAPVVLATLASKNALATGGPAHNCTISGKLSGNTSTHGTDQSCAIGLSPGYWKHPDSPQNHTWSKWDPATQPFNGASCDGASLPDAFPGKKVLEVLNMGGGNSGSPYKALARAVIASVQNFYKFGTDYGIRAGEAIQMYASVYSSASYQVKPGVYWSADCCTAYLQSLYTLESGESSYGSISGCSGL